MNTSFTRKQIRLSAACALTLGFAFGSAQAGDVAPGAHIWRNADGEWCWNREFNTTTIPQGCGLQPVAQGVTPAPAPMLVAQAPAPVSVQAQYVAPVRTQPAPAAVLSERPPKMDRN